MKMTINEFLDAPGNYWGMGDNFCNWAANVMAPQSYDMAQLWASMEEQGMYLWQIKVMQCALIPIHIKETCSSLLWKSLIRNKPLAYYMSSEVIEIFKAWEELFNPARAEQANSLSVLRSRLLVIQDNDPDKGSVSSALTNVLISACNPDLSLVDVFGDLEKAIIKDTVSESNELNSDMEEYDYAGYCVISSAQCLEALKPLRKLQSEIFAPMADMLFNGVVPTYKDEYEGWDDEDEDEDEDEPGEE